MENLRDVYGQYKTVLLESVNQGISNANQQDVTSKSGQAMTEGKIQIFKDKMREFVEDNPWFEYCRYPGSDYRIAEMKESDDNCYWIFRCYNKYKRFNPINRRIEIPKYSNVFVVIQTMGNFIEESVEEHVPDNISYEDENDLYICIGYNDLTSENKSFNVGLNQYFEKTEYAWNEMYDSMDGEYEAISISNLNLPEFFKMLEDFLYKFQDFVNEFEEQLFEQEQDYAVDDAFDIFVDNHRRIDSTAMKEFFNKNYAYQNDEDDE